ncbi:DNA mismatch repair protein MutS [Pseudahrensia aquimaris]|uniref:DNA mismatch repair protein MutS n=1 Tax=Pseudahrensia aquimaris TaxID=744461 RepID=A0ABW3FJL9_9HYPH
MSAPTPMMAQYIEIKAANPDSLLFYRMGDFYELFFGDAEIASRALGITLTKRGKHMEQDIPMCGVPVHAADDYLQRLIGLGHRVAVCEQVEDPAEAKKRGSKSVVKRDVVRLVTPGTITEERLLDAGQASVLAALARVRGSDGDDYAIAAIDISTGAFHLTSTNASRLSADLARIAPRELIMADTVFEDGDMRSVFEMLDCAIQPQPASMFDSVRAAENLQRFYGVKTLDGFGQFNRAELAAANGAIAYIEKTQIGERPALMRPSREQADRLVYIDAATRTNLELTQTLSGHRDGSLLKAMDRTVSGLGARLLAERLTGPLTDADQIGKRLDEVSFFLGQDRLRDDVRSVLKGLADMPRALSRLALNRGGPRDLAAIRIGLEGAQMCADLFKTLNDPLPENTARDVALLQDKPLELSDLLTCALAEDLPLLARDGGFVCDGYDADLDEQRGLSRESRKVIAGLQSAYAEETGVKSLKIRHNNVLGFFIEVTALNAEPLQADLQRFRHRQTMANAMRFTTDELAELESKIANAAGRALQIELGHFTTMQKAVLDHASPLQAIAAALARLDVAAAMAELAEEQGYARPTVDASLEFSITAGRHPVVEQALRKQAANPFVANDCAIGGNEGCIWLLTGPNMGGKSTFLRQNALIAIMAQMGSFVPAGAAHIGVVDRLFSRVGAADDLARGRSTFMVEMVETAAILNQAGERSLVILDEIGRGTATFDGLSIAWAAIEHLHAVNKSRTLFATHYHELTALSAKLERLSNVTLSVKEWDGDVVFLHEIIEGSADRSYGIQVARLAGLPDAVISRARAVLDQLESQNRERGTDTLIDDLPLFSATPQAPAQSSKASQIEEKLSSLHIDDMTPRDAMEALYALKQMLGSKP